LIRIVVLLALALPAATAFGREISGVVKHVQDGDSFILRDPAGGEITVRLAECDAPERHQPYADEARAHLRRLIEDRVVDVLTNQSDRYGRVVGRVYRGPVDVNAAMVEAGFAWAHLKYLTDRDFLRLEAAARENRRGLWADRNKPLEPWVFRQQTPLDGDSETESGLSRDGDCVIKGNINREGTKLYHVPGSRSYAKTRVSVARGERWFCTEQEAQAAGWRPAEKTEKTEETEETE
jgi:endonuclease YncB( thermonuclease family)